ncbi:ribonuclease Y [Apilactobacillus bombintestini]|uniref:Ribonuclease Y n=1 Tax=Apilactobacillus bombintestini TaxID=2419772 RepID=A0A387B1K2_9LACO|nr:ribonuclease Y [Apilactobacillus bombintestini]AYF93030.1 ribonuclease Y [Apilactobacillus bombintestini]
MIGLITVLFLILGAICGYFFSNMRIKSQIDTAKRQAQHHLKKSADEYAYKAKKIIADDKQDVLQYQKIADDEITSQQEENNTREQRLYQHEKYLDQMKTRLLKFSQDLKSQSDEQRRVQDDIDDVLLQAKDIWQQREEMLQNISRVDKNTAKQTVLNQTSNELSREKDIEVKYNLSESKVAANKIANDLVIEAIQRGPRDEPRSHIERNVNVPNGDVKAKLIGKDEQHIRLLESLTGTDLIFDEDVPLLLHIVTHDPIRREIVRNTIESLIISHHFTNSNIEYLVNITTQKVNAELRETGENVVHSLRVGRVHPDLMKIIGKMKYRTSYGQNVLYHSVETAQLTGALAAELGLNTQLAKRAGLLHDIGKSIDHEVGGTHVELGVKLTQVFHEDDVVVNAIYSHHGDVEPDNPISILVATADAISGARPGARSESIEEYVTRLRNLEAIANRHKGVKDSYAIQAGREIRIIVNPEMLNDDRSQQLTHCVKDQIQDELTYPGKIKVTTIRELKAVQYVGKAPKKHYRNAVKEG